jgi:hypothetical protein
MHARAPVELRFAQARGQFDRAAGEVVQPCARALVVGHSECSISIIIHTFVETAIWTLAPSDARPI